MNTKARITLEYPANTLSAEVLFRVYRSLCTNLKAEIISDYHFHAEFRDEGDQHSPRRALMWYRELGVVATGNANWIIGFGVVGGNGYLFDQMEADLVCRRIDGGKLDSSKLDSIIRPNRIGRSSTFDRFRYSHLASVDDNLMQVIRGNESHRFDLRPWARKRYNDGRPIDYPADKSITDCNVQFSRFLPRDCVLDWKLVRDLSRQLTHYIRGRGEFQALDYSI